MAHTTVPGFSDFDAQAGMACMGIWSKHSLGKSTNRKLSARRTDPSKLFSSLAQPITAADSESSLLDWKSDLMKWDINNSFANPCTHCTAGPF